MRIFIVSDIFERHVRYEDKVIDEMCEALRYHYSGDYDPMDKSVEIFITDQFSSLSRLEMLHGVLNHLSNDDKIILVSGYESSKFCQIISTIAKEYATSKIVYPEDFNKMVDDYRKGVYRITKESKDNDACEDKQPKKIFISGAPDKRTKQKLEYALSLYLEIPSDEIEYVYSTPIAIGTVDEKLKKTKDMISQIKESELVVYFSPYDDPAPEREIANMCGCSILTEIETEDIMSKYPIENITVRELIEKLENFDEDLPVVLNEGTIGFLKSVTEDGCYDRTGSSDCVLLSTFVKEK